MKTCLCFLLWMTVASMARAGSLYEVRCTNAKCGLVAEVGIGGGMKFEEASGYCPKCEKFVSVTWPRGEKPKMAPVRFWDGLVGRLREVFRCKTCQTPFVRLGAIEDLKFCPKCGQESLRAKLTMMFD
ncbi:MAG: hypothetical protein U1F71_10440 [Verrucomicrobiaceae bacterium]